MQSIPTVTQDDLNAFHEQTFGRPAPQTQLDRLQAGNIEQETDPGVSFEQDDGLGYYPDGRKRTLNDDQIAMFRSSEIYSIIRKRQVAQENGHTDKSHQPDMLTTSSSEVHKEVPTQTRWEVNSNKHHDGSRRSKKRKIGHQRSSFQDAEEDVPPRRVIRELDAAQSEDQVLDY